MKRFLTLAILLSSICGSAHAAMDLRLDMSTLVSSTAGNWNNISNVAGLTSNLIDFNTGLGTGVSIDGTGSPWRDFFGDDFATFPNQDWVVQPSTADGAGLDQGTTGSYFVAGLNDGKSYTVEIVSARTSFNYLNTLTVNGNAANRTYLGTPVVTPWGSTIDGLTPGNWLIWDNVQSTGGIINLTDVASSNTLGMINAIRIVEVPEPASVILMGMGVLGTMAFRIRRSRGK